MPTTGTITATLLDGTTEVYTVSDTATIVKGDVVVKFHGKIQGASTETDIELTRAAYRKLSYS